MKKIMIIAALFCTLFSTMVFAAKEQITDEQEISKVLANYYPTIKNYYEAGVIEIESLQEETLFEGSTEYDIKYKLVKNYYDGSEIDNVLKENYPDVYAMKTKGVIKDVSAFRYVDKETGEIFTKVAYNKNMPRRPVFPRFMRERRPMAHR